MRGWKLERYSFSFAGVSRSGSTLMNSTAVLAASGPRRRSTSDISNSAVGQMSGQWVKPKNTRNGLPRKSASVTRRPSWSRRRNGPPTADGCVCAGGNATTTTAAIAAAPAAKAASTAIRRRFAFIDRPSQAVGDAGRDHVEEHGRADLRPEHDAGGEQQRAHRRDADEQDAAQARRVGWFGQRGHRHPRNSIDLQRAGADGVKRSQQNLCYSTVSTPSTQPRPHGINQGVLAVFYCVYEFVLLRRYQLATLRHRSVARESSPMIAEIPVAEKARDDIRTWTVKRPARRSSFHVAVIGAGPYGLSVAAHLKAANVDTRVFGDAMSFWRGNMPKGMRLRSPWCASHLADAKGEFSLDRYAASHGFAPTEQSPREDFVRYGEWFQRMAVPDLDPRKVARVDIAEQGFRLRLEDGEVLSARRVVIAVGLANQSFKPAVFEQLPATLASHSSEHASFDAFRGRRVVVIGRGQSACESAVLLSEAGAEVELLSRGEVRWIGAETENVARSPGWKRRARELLAAKSAVGPFPLDWVNEVPGIIRHLPLSTREWLAIRSLRPAATAWLRPRAGSIRFTAGAQPVGVQAARDKVEIRLDSGTSVLADHVLLGTGYRIDIAKLGILASPLLNQIRRGHRHPLLAGGFESSVPGLHFVGSSAIKSFGPLMRFIAGAGYAARAVAATALAERQ